MATFLNASLRGLAGDKLLDSVAEQQRWDILEVMWRSGDTASASAAGPRLASSATPKVVDLVAHAIIEPVPGQPDRAGVV